ncbi:hypothetical protein [Rugamonas aquatica]|uniref:Uncharacterized protein n=1 Tax=Rugamonas aquatica TaxID=2743357 RepID=A0A6A7N781_9BURK|nr:hypothetical protein [Rugamonas aquatica]MQA40748.1 hypothetical protein [Rugamonas aquatica]
MNNANAAGQRRLSLSANWVSGSSTTTCLAALASDASGQVRHPPRQRLSLSLPPRGDYDAPTNSVPCAPSSRAVVEPPPASPSTPPGYVAPAAAASTSTTPSATQYVEEGYRFTSQEDAKRLRHSLFYVKQPGMVLSPLNWPRFFLYLIGGRPQFSADVRRAFDSESEGGIVGTIDGLDDLIALLNASRLPERATAALQAGLYPVALPLVNFGAVGARAEFREVRAAYRENTKKLTELRTELLAHADVRAMDNGFLSSATTPTEFGLRLVAVLKARSQPVEADLLGLVVQYRALLALRIANALALGAAPAALVGAHGMLASIVACEGTALAAAIGGAGSQVAAATIMMVGNFVMGGAQVAMAVYGLVGVVRAIVAHGVLRKQAASIVASKSIQPATQNALLVENRVQKRLNLAIGLANAGLAGGQALMLAGGAIFGLGVPFLIAGSVLTIASIVVKLVAQNAYDKRFAYDLNNAEQARRGTGRPSVANLEQLRDKSLRAGVWREVFTTAQRVKERYGTKSLEVQKQRLLHELNAIYSTHDPRRVLYQEVYESAQELLNACMESGVTWVASYIALSGPENSENSAVKLRQFEDLAPKDRIAKLFSWAIERRIDGELSQEVVRQLVVSVAGLKNRSGHRYDKYLQRIRFWEQRRFLWDKRKTAYNFDVDTFINDIESKAAEVVELEHIVYRALEKTVAKAYAQSQRSELAAIHANLVSITAGDALAADLADSRV